MLPAIPLQVALYLTELVNRAVREGHSVSVIESASYSIHWGHRLAGMKSPTSHPLVRGVVEGARRKLGGLGSPSSRCRMLLLLILL